MLGTWHWHSSTLTWYTYTAPAVRIYSQRCWKYEVLLYKNTGFQYEYSYHLCLLRMNAWLPFVSSHCESRFDADMY